MKIGTDFTEGEQVEVKEDQSTTEETTEVVEESEESTAEEGATTEEVVAEPQKIKIGDKEFTSEELEGIVEKGGKVKEWETKMPGFNLDTLMPDYTRKSQKLAQYEKHPAPKVETVDISDIDAEEVQKFEKIAKHYGYIKTSDMAQSSVEVQKNAFIASHPEYQPGNEVNDAKWNQLMEQFSLYNWQAHPQKVEEMLEKAHSEVSKTWNEATKNQQTQQAVITKKAVANAAATSGGNSQKQSNATSNTALADKYRALGWAEEDIKEILN